MKDRLTISREIMVRVPQFHMAAKLEEVWEELKESIRVSSGEFYEMIKDVRAGEIGSLPPQVFHTVWKYFNRAKFRPIPYGSFAGFGIARFDKDTAGDHITIEPGQVLHRLIGWEVLNREDSLKTKLTDATLLFANSSWYKSTYQVRYLIIKEGVFSLAEVSIVPMLLEILNQCRKPVTFKKLVTELNLTHGEFKLIRQMQQLQLLFTENMPNIIGDDFFQRVGITNDPAFPQYIIAERKPVTGYPDTAPFKSLLSLIPSMEKIMRPATRSGMDSFKEGFIKKFEERSIPLMRALDPELGISYSNTVEQDTEDGFVKQYTEKINNTVTGRSREMEKLLLSALAKSSREPILLDYLENDKKGELSNLPNSIGVLCSIVDGLVILDHLGGANASSLAGRFSMVSADAEKLCRDWALQEQHANPDVLFFDIAYSAEKATDNINRRKHLYPLQLSLLNFDTSNDPLTLDDIFLTARNGQLILFSARHRKRLVPRLASAYNYSRSDLSVFRFLCDLQFEGITPFLLFNISSTVPDLDFYPRVQFKNIILSPAKWKVNVNELDVSVENPLDSLRLYLQKMKLPRYLVTRTHDRTMCFDCDSETDLSALYFILKKFKSFYLEEGFVSKEAVVTDTLGNKYASQFLLSVNHSQHVYKPFKVSTRSIPFNAVRQNFAAGSEWLYYEIFSHPRMSDTILDGKIRSLLKSQKKKIHSWFFIRYNEDGHHIRLRIKLHDPVHCGLLMSALAALLQHEIEEGIVTDFRLKTYKRELERYGHDLIEDIEKHFFRDSEYVCSLFNCGLSENEKYRSCIDLIGYLKHSEVFEHSSFQTIIESVSESFLKEHQVAAADFKQLNIQYAAFKKQAPGFLNNSRQKKFKMFLESFRTVLLKCPVERRAGLFADLVHMHVNRLFPNNQRTHEMVVYYIGVKMEQHRKAVTASGPVDSLFA